MFTTATTVHFVLRIMHVLLHRETTKKISLHFFSIYHIKVKNAPEDKVKYEKLWAMESPRYSSKFYKAIINITTTGYQKV